jgi:8-oxo-dGTP pyrophosphatase MutT (NUDIX family)
VSYEGSYVWKVRQLVGEMPLLVPGVALMLRDQDDRVLLQRRDDTREWDLPGGSVEEGQSFLATALRELAEECGIDVEAGDVGAFACLSEPEWERIVYPDGSVQYGYTMCFQVQRWRGEPHGRDGEALELRFFAPGDLPSRLTRHARRVLELWDESRREGSFRVG